MQLRRLDNEEIRWLPVDPDVGWSDTGHESQDVTDLSPGYSYLTVFTNGIPSESRIIGPCSREMTLEEDEWYQVGLPCEPSGDG